MAIAFALAWLASRVSQQLAERIVRRYEARNVDPAVPALASSPRSSATRRSSSLVQTSVRYVAYVLATLFAISQISGVRGNGALAGASLLVVLLGFALQRFLIDILSGVFMQFEGWFAIGDSVVDRAARAWPASSRRRR